MILCTQVLSIFSKYPFRNEFLHFRVNTKENVEVIKLFSLVFKALPNFEFSVYVSFDFKKECCTGNVDFPQGFSSIGLIVFCLVIL